MASPKELATAAADEIAERSGAASHEAVVVLGSGWTDALDSLGDVVWYTRAESITGFVAATAPGHAGELASLDLEGHRILVFSGRTHLYGAVLAGGQQSESPQSIATVMVTRLRLPISATVMPLISASATEPATNESLRVMVKGGIGRNAAVDVGLGAPEPSVRRVARVHRERARCAPLGEPLSPQLHNAQ